MRYRRCRFIPLVDVLSRRIVPDGGAAAAAVFIDPGSDGSSDDGSGGSDGSDGSDGSSTDSSVIDAALNDLNGGSSDDDGDDDSGIDPMAPQFPDDSEFTVATPVSAVDPFA